MRSGRTMPVWKAFLYSNRLLSETAIVVVEVVERGKALWTMFLSTGTLIIEPVRPNCECLYPSSHIWANAKRKETSRSSSSVKSSTKGNGLFIRIWCGVEYWGIEPSFRAW